MAQTFGDKDIVTTITGTDTYLVSQPQAISNTPTIETQYIVPTIQNTSQIPYAQNVVYTQPGQQQIYQQQPSVSNGNSLADQLALQKIQGDAKEIARLKGELAKKNNEPGTQKLESEIISKVNANIRADIEQQVQQAYNNQKKAAEDQQTENKNLKQQVELLTKQLETLNNSKQEEERIDEVRSEFQDQIDALQSRNDILTQQQDDLKKQQNLPSDLERVLEEQNELQRKKFKQAEERCQRAEAGLSRLINELTSTEGKINSQNESMSLFKKFLIAIGLSDEPDQLIKLREKVHEISEKIEKQKEKVVKNKDILTKEEDDLLTTVEDNIKKINALQEKNIAEKEAEIKLEMDARAKFRQNSEIQDLKKQLLEDKEKRLLNSQINLIKEVGLDDKNRSEIEEEVRKQKLWKIQEKTREMKNKNPKYSKDTINKAKGNSFSIGGQC